MHSILLQSSETRKVITGLSSEFEVNLKGRHFFGEQHDFWGKVGNNGDEIEVKTFFFFFGEHHDFWKK